VEPFTLLVVIGAAGLGGCVQGLTGFGSTVVALPLLGLALPVRDAVAVGCLMALATNFILVFRLGRYVNRPALTLLVLASLPGMVGGAFVLRLASELWLKALLGLTVGGLGLVSLCRARLAAGPDRVFGVAAGLVAGCLGVAIGINGPPVVAWAARQAWPRPMFLATLNAYFLLAGCAIVGVQAGEGLLTPGVLGLFAAGALAVFGGVRLGQALCGRFDDTAFRRLVSGLLVVIGLALLWQVGAAVLVRMA